MVHLRCDEPVQFQVLSQNQAGRSNEMTRPTLIYDVGMDSGHSSKLQHQVKWALNSHSLRDHLTVTMRDKARFRGIRNKAARSVLCDTCLMTQF